MITKKSKFFAAAAVAGLFLFAPAVSFAQNAGIQAGATAIEQATTDLQAYFEPVTRLIYIIAAIVGLWGGFKIYSKWQAGDQDVQKTAVGWVGSLLFLLAVAAVLQAVFFT
ncbi:protein of unknown function [Dyadobacter sp. SG02]|uniref:DUF4134 domain-containing protein n=1 Tax=Dyadobacter sp. SG02 TaxID=1855291 RepID=UPI0008B414B1|nr:DUF4134 domain-containing protein [Dyadobacter sp. SG02]SEJ74581.1 protein of unknown function [Dyadobacter sp. SG02]